MPPPRKRPTRYNKVAVDTEEIMGFGEMGNMLTKLLLGQAAEPNLLGYVPHAKQIQFHSAQTNGRLYIGGNRSGKTTGGVVEDLWWATRRHPYCRIPEDTQIRVRAIGSDFTSGVEQILLPQFKRWVVPSDLVNGSWEHSWHKVDRKLTLANGSFIEFKSYDQELVKHAGTSRHVVHFDEEPPKDVFTENLLRLLDVGGRWHMTMTPVDGMTWVYDDLYEAGIKGEKNNLTVVTVDMDDNPYLSETEKEIVLGFLDADERKARKEGKFVERSGLIFKGFEEKHILRGYESGIWQVPVGWRVYMSVDHGFANPTAILWHAVSPANDVVTFHEYYQTQAIIKDHVAYIKDFEARNRIKVYMRTGDPAMKQKNGVTGTSILQEYASGGIFLALESVPRSVSIGLDKMTSYLRDSPRGAPFWRVSNCPNLIRELKRYHFKRVVSSKTRLNNNSPEEPQKKDDHAIDSTRYFFTLMPDLTPHLINKVVDMYEPGSMLHTLAVMNTAPPDVQRPVKWNIKRATSFQELGSDSTNFEDEDY